MGQKVNPHGLRVGVIKDWDSRWFTSKRDFGDTLVEDYKLRKQLKKQLYNAGVPKIEIERTFDSQTGKPRVRVTVHCSKPRALMPFAAARSFYTNTTRTAKWQAQRQMSTPRPAKC